MSSHQCEEKLISNIEENTSKKCTRKCFKCKKYICDECLLIIKNNSNMCNYHIKMNKNSNSVKFLIFSVKFLIFLSQFLCIYFSIFEIIIYL